MIACVIATASANAQDVTLSSRDGSLEVGGTLIGYDGEYYRVLTEFGPLTLDGTSVICAGPACPNLEDFVAEVHISGEPDYTRHLLPKLLGAFAATQEFGVTVTDSLDEVTIRLDDIHTNRPVARIHLNVMTTAEAFATFVAGQVEYVVSGRAVIGDEVALAAEAGLGDLSDVSQATILAIDAVVPLVSPNNPVGAIDVNRLGDIFIGELDDWNEIGGAQADISPIVPRPFGPISSIFQENVLLERNRGFSADLPKATAATDLGETLRGDPFAIGLGLRSHHLNLKALSLNDGCGFSVVAGSSEIQSGDYSLGAPVYLYETPVRAPKIMDEFLRFVQSADGQATIRRAGFVALRPMRVPLVDHGRRLLASVRHGAAASLETAVAALAGHDRLTLSFRFRKGGLILDPRSVGNLKHLAKMLETGELVDLGMILAGFASDKGRSLEMAEAVKAALLSEAIAFDRKRVPIMTQGFGPTMPISCEESARAERLNQRVEVWLR